MPIRAVPLQGDVSWVVVRTLSTAFLRSSRSRAARLLRCCDCISSAPAGFTFDDQTANEDFIRLVMVENIHNGVHLAKSQGSRSSTPRSSRRS
ncbi:MAG: hypothetical protein ACJ8DH_05115 [Microvirga sp.]